MLEVTKLGFAFQYKKLFQDFSFELRSQEILHLKGPNGSGKSTLLSILAGLRTSNSGNIVYRKDGLLLSAQEATDYLPAEKLGHYLNMTARENLSFWTFLFNKASPDIERALLQWDLCSPLLDYITVQRFSTGMKKRLALARLSLSSKKIWLLDEPLNGLDERGIETFKELIIAHKKSGGAAVIVCHDAQVVQNLISSTRSFV